MASEIGAEPIDGDAIKRQLLAAGTCEKQRLDALSQRLGELGIAFLIIWMKTPTTVANNRAIEREIEEGYPSLHRGVEGTRKNAASILKTFDSPAEHELCVEIDA